MANQVNVDDLEIFRLFRAALVKFAQAADQSLSGASAHVGRMRFWLDSEQMSYWTSQIRMRGEALTRAKAAFLQKKLYKDASGHFRDASEEQKAAAKAEAALEEAKRKIEAVRKALPKLDRETDLYHSGVSRLGTIITGEIPKALARLDRLAARLEEYVQIAAPSGGGMPGSAEPSAFEGTVSRGGEAEAVAPPEEEKAAEESPAKKEGADVSDGQ